MRNDGMTMPGAEGHIIAQSQDEGHVMVDFFPILPWPIPTMDYAKTQLCEAKSKPNYVSNRRDYDYNPELQLHCYGATMTIDILISRRWSNELSKKER